MVRTRSPGVLARSFPRLALSDKSENHARSAPEGPKNQITLLGGIKKGRFIKINSSLKGVRKKMKKVLTLCIIHQEPKVLLGMKKIGFGKGRWNGFGGKVEQGESIEEAAKRELMEEVGITVKDIQRLGVLDFSWRDKLQDLEVHVFKANDFLGEPVESNEMIPQWFDRNEIPFDKMWQDDKHWLPLFLAGKKFRGKFIFDDLDNILNYSLDEIEEI